MKSFNIIITPLKYYWNFLGITLDHLIYFINRKHCLLLIIIIYFLVTLKKT